MNDYVGSRFLIFRVGEIICATDVRAVREILPPMSATRIPGAHESVIGVVNIRGQLTVLVDGKKALGQPSSDSSFSVVLLDVGSKMAGLAVDEVVDLANVGAEGLATREELPGVESRFVRAIGRREELSYVLLDIEALFSPILNF